MPLDTLFYNKQKPVASIQQQYIVLALVLGIFVIGVSVIGYLDMVSKSNQLVQQVKNISGLLEKTAQFRNYTSTANQAIDTFMLDNNPVLVEFVRGVARINGGRAVVCLPGELGRVIMVEEMKRRERK